MDHAHPDWNTKLITNCSRLSSKSGPDVTKSPKNVNANNSESMVIEMLKRRLRNEVATIIIEYKVTSLSNNIPGLRIPKELSDLKFDVLAIIKVCLI